MTHLKFYNCVNVTRKAVLAIISHCQQLKTLNVARCRSSPRYRVTNEDILDEAEFQRNDPESLPNKSITNLDLSLCEWLTSRCLWFICRLCPSLRSLTIKYSNITDIGVKGISMFCPKLEFLKMSDCDRLTGTSLIYLASYGGGRLRRLVITGCSREMKRIVRLFPDLFACCTVETEWSSDQIMP